MRTGSLVLAAYVMCVIVAAAWRLFGGAMHDAVPDLGALTAAYLGLTARRQVAPAVLGSVLLGYLVDLISGAPPGLGALVLGATGLVARAIQQRILVRGTAMTIAFSAFVAVIAQVIGLLVRVLYHVPRALDRHRARAPRPRHRRDRARRPARVARVPPHRRDVRAHPPRARRRARGARTLIIRQQSGPAGQGPALPELHRRLRYVAIVFVAALALLVGRLWQLQVMRGDSYYERTLSNVVKESYLPSVRGKIVDRNGVPLADNRPAFNIYATPSRMTPQLEQLLVSMLALSDDDLDKIHERLAVGTKHDATQPVLVLEDQGRDRAALVEQSRARLPGVEVRHEPYRYYPLGDTAAQVLGYMTQMTAGEADRLTTEGNYDPSELVGRYGLEAQWENYLRGKKGISRIRRGCARQPARRRDRGVAD